jgi:hypothetical protein
MFLLTPTGPLRGRRWSDYWRSGRRQADQTAGRRACDVPPPPPQASTAPGDRRNAGGERRAG